MSRPKKKKSQGRFRFERSAGVVVFRDDTATDQRLFLLLDYGRHWDYPKGHVEEGETDRMAAIRELEEETGIREATFLDNFSEEIVYYFRSPKGRLVQKTVAFFLASTTTAQVRLSHEHVACAWLPADQARQRLTYPTAKQVFQSALKFLSYP